MRFLVNFSCDAGNSVSNAYLILFTMHTVTRQADKYVGYFLDDEKLINIFWPAATALLSTEPNTVLCKNL